MGKWVLTDRFALSSLAYQTWKGLQLKDVTVLHGFACYFPDYGVGVPHQNIILTATDKTVAKRKALVYGGADNFESRPDEFSQHVAKTYLDYHNMTHSGEIIDVLGRSCLLNANGTIEQVQKLIQGVLSQFIKST